MSEKFYRFATKSLDQSFSWLGCLYFVFADISFLSDMLHLLLEPVSCAIVIFLDEEAFPLKNDCLKKLDLVHSDQSKPMTSVYR